MGLQHITRRSFAGLCLASAAWASRWDEARFPDWNESLIDKLLTDSPWAHPWRGTAVQPVAHQRMMSSWAQIGGIGWPRLPSQGGAPAALRVGVDLTIRWASALPVRRAMALQEFGRTGLDQPRAVELLSTEPDHFAIELAGLPQMLVNPSLERDLRKAKLFVPNHAPLSPLSVDAPTIGAQVNVTLRFPRASKIDPEAGKIELLVQAGTLHIEERFKLRPMVYEGRLAL